MKNIVIFLLALAAVGTNIIDAANDPNCGLKGPKFGFTRIVGGVDTEPLEFPWQGSLRYNSGSSYYHTCGCSLINQRWALTAAHCVNRSNVVDPSRYRFVGGEHNSIIVEGTEVTVDISNIYPYPLYNSQQINGDVALLKLARDLDLQGKESHLGTVCIPDAEPIDTLADQTCIATGWGHTSWQGTSPVILQKVNVQVMAQEKCQSIYSSIQTITDLMLCFGENNKGTCQGDSGGPLNCKVNNKWYTYGATSFGVTCAGPTYPSVTARVSEFSAWIWQTIDNNS